MRHGSSQANINLHDVASWVLLANLQRNDPRRPSTCEPNMVPTCVPNRKKHVDFDFDGCSMVQKYKKKEILLL
jgi:hypothetical protein